MSDLPACHHCGLPIEPGQEHRYVIEQGTNAAPEVVVHRKWCAPAVEIRRYP